MSSLRSPFALVAFAILSGSFALACRSSEARRREGEAAVLAHAIDSLRDAPNPAKAALLARLRETPCSDAEICGLKDACAAAYEKHLGAIGAGERAKALLAEPDGGAPAALAAALELKRAEEDLARAQGMTESCVSAQGKLKRALKP